MQIGFLNWVFFIIVLILFACGVVYFVVVPTCTFYKLTKNWKQKRKLILFTLYSAVLTVSGIAFWYLPDYYLKTFSVDVVGSIWHRTAGVIFLSAPLIFIGVVGVIGIAYSLKRKRV